MRYFYRCSNPIVGVVIPNDVYLTYSIFILTSMMRITSFPLTVTSELSRPELSKVEENVPALAEKTKWLVHASGPSDYVSILGNEPYKPPTLVSSPIGLPSFPKLSLPGSPSGTQEFVLTPDTLRFIAKTVGQISTQVREIHIAYRQVVTRTSLQKDELTAQAKKCGEMEKRIEELKGPLRQDAQTRFNKIQDEQKILLARLDRLLQALMKQALPELSEQETKWFEELKRMKQDILGAGRYDEDSLVARTRMVSMYLTAHVI